MATIQIRDIPDDVYETIRQEARAAGKSLQAYMRSRVIELARGSDRAAALARLESYLAEQGGIGASAEEIVADVHAARR